MKYTRFILAITVFCFGFSKIAAADSIPKRGRIALQLAPLSLVDFYNGSCYKLGTEVRLSKSLYVSVDCGGYLPNFNGLKNMKGGNLDFRIKYRLPHANSLISLGYFYKKQSFEYHDAYEEQPDIPVTVYTRKIVHCLNIHYEYKLIDKYPWYITGYAGLGMRFRDVKSSFETHHDFDRLVEGGDSQTLYFVLIPGETTWLNLNFGLRIGYYLF